MAMIDEKKEFIGMIRNKSNHILVIFVTTTAGVTKFLIDKEFGIWFIIGLFVVIVSFITYILLSLIEYKNIKEIAETKEQIKKDKK